jgi:8-amino-7-oxononanoate synthase
VLGEAAMALEASGMLEREGFLVRAIRPPTVPEGTARLRVTFTATHVEDDVLRLADLVRDKLPVRRGKS